VVVGNAELVV